jgi:hypothetical protein
MDVDGIIPKYGYDERSVVMTIERHGHPLNSDLFLPIVPIKRNIVSMAACGGSMTPRRIDKGMASILRTAMKI